MKKQFASTQVCEVTLERREVEKIVIENLLTRGGEPSYDFNTAHPIVVWRDDGSLVVRFVQGAVYAKEAERFLQLHPQSTVDALRLAEAAIMRQAEERNAAARERLNKKDNEV